jgi:hypothetical protein
VVSEVKHEDGLASPFFFVFISFVQRIWKEEEGTLRIDQFWLTAP